MTKRKINHIPYDKLKKYIEDESMTESLMERADEIRRVNYGDKVYIRGLIEVSNICKNNCYYCGIRRSNDHVNRYRLAKDEILRSADFGYGLGFRTFVMQGGEDPSFSRDFVVDAIREIKNKYPDTAITLSLGERSYEDYKAFYDAGADRYLLRQETSNPDHYAKIHPKEMSLAHRQECLHNLKKIGYQVGGGFMVDSPYQTTDDLIRDIRFLEDLEPDMVGIGPFLVSHDTPFKDFKDGSFTKTLRMVAILRIVFPYALIPATTALGTINPKGRELGLKAGANVLMPNLSPAKAKKSYNLYDNKLNTGLEAAEAKKALEKEIASFGYQIVTDRGDVRDKN
ncbi:[FeFe] hydrogenase H-cluster radical SAM maturase HydE [Anaerococcus sp. Marseille-P3915]|uniref:[FeFe] hydrogenase H-cluster radical SAM maturase HydE n=1 Tax=Anaerococcus sp. Marseille-P3915 TaxID=2057799 RepID=UPI000D0B0F9F|nr:[FeFe] hydrogenase H-cluster radical SAM maturase HydE [Anaerococcus sp. Marseille-P3915]